MKRTFKSLAVLALSALAMVSCQKELLGPATQEGQEVEVSLDLTTPLMGTKAYADGKSVDVVHVHVYQHDANGNLTYIAPATQGAAIETPSKDVRMTNGAATYSTRLVTGQKYTFVFWAEKSGNSPYSYDDANQTITVDYSNAAGNDESRDAFYAVLPNVTITGAYSASVTLNRPFAQINFGASDYDDAVAAGITVTGASVKLTKIGNSINLLNGEVTGEETVTFANANLPNATLSAASENYKYVAMDYVLVGKDRKTLSDVTLTLAADGTLSATPEYTYSNVPLQGNYRTNIVGSLFTSPADINITVNPAFGNPDENIVAQNVASIAAANEALNNGATSVTIANVTASEAVTTKLEMPATSENITVTIEEIEPTANLQIEKPATGANPESVSVVLPASASVSNLTINLPESHVEVNGASYTSINATTSNNTLVIGSDVKVTTLTIEAGAVEIYGKVGTLTNNGTGAVKVWAVGDIETWVKANEAGAQRIELTENISSATDTKLYVPVQGTVEGNGKEISGSISLNVNALGGTVQNLNFKDIHNSANKLSAIYAPGINGKLVITGCSFDTFDWDAIQTTPVAGAEVEIVNNTFRYSADAGTNNRRYIHIESKPNVDFAAKVFGNYFYDNAKLRMSAIEVYFFTDINKINISSNYIDAPAKVCILKNSGSVATEVLKGMTVKNAPDGDDVHIAGYIDISGDQRIFTSLDDAIKELNATNENRTLDLFEDFTWDTGNAGNSANILFNNAGRLVTINANDHKITAKGSGGIKSDANVTINNATIVDNTAYQYENGETAFEFTYLEFQGAGSFTFSGCTFENTIMADAASVKFNNCTFLGKATLESNAANEYALWIACNATVKNSTFHDLYRGIKVAQKYGTSPNPLYEVTIDGCSFKNIEKKPGVVIDAYTYGSEPIQMFGEVTIKNSTFENVQAGDQGAYIYETDNLEPVLENNTVIGRE